VRRIFGSWVACQLTEASLAPLKSRAAAELALTGDDDFYYAARLAAHKQGMYLNEFALWKWNPANCSSSPSSSQSAPEPSASSKALTPASSPTTPGSTPAGLYSTVVDPDAREVTAAYETLPSSPDSPGTWQLMPTPSESELISFLGFGRIPPDRRNFMFLRKRPVTRTQPILLSDETLDSMQAGLMGEQPQPPVRVLVKDSKPKPRKKLEVRRASPPPLDAPMEPELPEEHAWNTMSALVTEVQRSDCSRRTTNLSSDADVSHQKQLQRALA